MLSYGFIQKTEIIKLQKKRLILMSSPDTIRLINLKGQI